MSVMSASGTTSVLPRDTKKTLKFVQLLCRHGNRTAISELSDENDSVRAAWREQLPCKDTRHALARSAGVRTQVRLRDEHNVAKGLHEHQGQLTSLGVRQLQQIGGRLRESLVHEHGLLPSACCQQVVRVRSTPMRRTVQSAQALLLGLWPLEGDEDAEGGTRPEVHVDSEIDAFVAVERPAGLVEALTRAKERSEAAAPAEPLMEAHPALARAAKGPTKALSAVAVWDSLSRRRDHGLELPEGITQAVFASADSHISEKLRAQYGGEEGVALAQIVVGQLVLAMVDELTRAAERPHELEHKLSVWAAHDTTMIPVLVILGCYDFLWPPIASELRLELWECHEHEEHLVRVVFNDKPLKLPFAAGAREGDFCEVSVLCQALRAKMPDTRASL